MRLFLKYSSLVLLLIDIRIPDQLNATQYLGDFIARKEHVGVRGIATGKAPACKVWSEVLEIWHAFTSKNPLVDNACFNFNSIPHSVQNCKRSS